MSQDLQWAELHSLLNRMRKMSKITRSKFLWFRLEEEEQEQKNKQEKEMKNMKQKTDTKTNREV
jgi:hypothetical protein